MSISVSRSIFSSLLNRNRRKFIHCLFSSRLQSDEAGSKSEKDSPDKLEAAILRKYSEPLLIEKLELPKKLQPAEVLIDINYCALNGLDVLLCENLYSDKQNIPFVPGYEVSGKLIEVGEGAKEAGYNIGDRVVALNKERFGGLADQCIAEIGDVWKIPSSIRSVDAVCLLENYMTALIGLEKHGCIEENNMVLINVGIGGIGLAAVDIAANVFLAKVIGVSFSEDRNDKIRERGAFHAFTYKEKKLSSEIEEIAQEKGIKDIFEGEAGQHFKKILKGFMKVYQSKTPSKNFLRDDNFGVVVQHLSREGKIIVAGVAHTKSYAEKPEEGEDVFCISGINLKDYRKRKNDLYRQTGDDIISFFEEGLVKPSPSMIAGLYEVNTAFKFISEMKACGKVVIDIKNKDAEAKVLWK
ncbi:hypothetical protein QAD02_019787 [Eretmocerus hayati]|uniref:Uncharacterized protein n=1 Tax=Eretmocerus hayati TaxID=131215 RepID=A0ACC2PK83_9HYME|nr:hypothetical protein QAD02_019787 [Eretmocerus hayati]